MRTIASAVKDIANKLKTDSDKFIKILIEETDRKLMSGTVKMTPPSKSNEPQKPLIDSAGFRREDLTIYLVSFDVIVDLEDTAKKLGQTVEELKNNISAWCGDFEFTPGRPINSVVSAFQKKYSEDGLFIHPTSRTFQGNKFLFTIKGSFEQQLPGPIGYPWHMKI